MQSVESEEPLECPSPPGSQIHGSAAPGPGQGWGRGEFRSQVKTPMKNVFSTKIKYGSRSRHQEGINNPSRIINEQRRELETPVGRIGLCGKCPVPTEHNFVCLFVDSNVQCLNDFMTQSYLFLPPGPPQSQKQRESHIFQRREAPVGVYGTCLALPLPSGAGWSQLCSRSSGPNAWHTPGIHPHTRP